MWMLFGGKQENSVHLWFFFYAMLQILIFNINNALKLLAAATSEAQGKVTFLNLSLDKSPRSKLMAFMLEVKQLRLREVK